MVSKKILGIGAGVGLLLLILAPIMGSALAYSVVETQSDKKVDEESINTVREAYTYEFTLEKGQKITIEFSVYAVNSTANLIIVGKGIYDTRYAENDTSGSLDAFGKNFLVTTPQITNAPENVNTGSLTKAVAAYDEYFYIEFMGDGTTGSEDLWSEPGEYVIVVYGQNPSAEVDDTHFKFNIEVKAEGNGPVLETVFLIVGALMLVGVVVLALVSAKKALSEPVGEESEPVYEGDDV